MPRTLQTPIASLLATTIALLALPARAADDCAAFARHGVYDTQAHLSAGERAGSFRSWLCHAGFASRQDADVATAELGYGTLDIAAGAADWGAFVADYCTGNVLPAAQRAATEAYVARINAGAAERMLACQRKEGLHARLVPGATLDAFYLQLVFNPVGMTRAARVRTFGITGATACIGSVRIDAPLGGEGAEEHCLRLDGGPVDVRISANAPVVWDSPSSLPRSAALDARQRQPVAIPATAFVRGANVGVGTCDAGEGTLGNAESSCHNVPNAVDFDVPITAAGRYRLDAEYAARAPRPVRVSVNGRVLREHALGELTESWDNSGLEWAEIGRVDLPAGTSTIRLDRPNVFPHIHALRLVPVDD